MLPFVYLWSDHHGPPSPPPQHPLLESAEVVFMLLTVLGRHDLSSDFRRFVNVNSTSSHFFGVLLTRHFRTDVLATKTWQKRPKIAFSATFVIQTECRLDAGIRNRKIVRVGG